MMGRLFKAKIGMKLGVVVAAFSGSLSVALASRFREENLDPLCGKERDGNDYLRLFRR